MSRGERPKASIDPGSSDNFALTPELQARIDSVLGQPSGPPISDEEYRRRIDDGLSRPMTDREFAAFLRIVPPLPAPPQPRGRFIPHPSDGRIRRREPG